MGSEMCIRDRRMEITAAFEAVKAIGGTLKIVSDSTYVVNCFRDRWWEGWVARGWKNSAKKPVANRDLWEPLVTLVRDRGDVTFEWVKGHSGDPMNDLVDRLAVESAETQQGRSGDEPPTDLGPADRPSRKSKAKAKASAAGSTPAEPAVAGRPIVVLGHKPPELGGYREDNPVARSVRARLREVLEAKVAMFPDLVVVSGLRLGAEMLGAEVAVDLGLPLVVVLPYPKPHTPWPKESREHFEDLCAGAREVITLQAKEPDNRRQAGAALNRRDAWLARNAKEAILVWDQRDELLGRLFRSLEDHLGEDVWIVDPSELVTPKG